MAVNGVGALLLLFAASRLCETSDAGQLLRFTQLKHTSNAKATNKIPNIDYAGLGYDPIRGNPHSELHDPGFRQAVIQLEYNTNATTSDGKWFVPDYVQVLQTVSCSYQTDSDEVTGSTSYQQSLSVDASLEVGYANAVKFTASAGYKQVREATTKYRRSFISSVARCVAYKAGINHNYEPFKVTKTFADAVKSLPAVRNDDAYVSFIAAYGTHFANRLYMGAKTVIRSEFESTNWTKMDEEGFNVKAGASASFVVSVAVSTATAEQKRLAATYDSSRRSYTESYLGSHPSPDGKWETWAAKTGETPYPIQYSLVPLTELLTTKFFPDVDEKSLATKRNLLNATIDVYCGRIPGCGLPDPDRDRVKMNRVNATFIATIHQSCRPGLSLLSCGIDTKKHGSKSDFHRYSVPISSTKCECNDNSGAVCSQWCTNSVKGFEIAIAENNDTFSVSCPSGKKVLGCHRRPDTSKEVSGMSYPTGDGNGCTCYDRFGAACYATCASNISSHEVRSEFGKGLVTVTCSPSNYVLGCGVKPQKSRLGEKWRYYQVASVNSCECYDNNAGVTCYAVCGQFT